jgi:glycine/D-amino acid oxidase-like deaminating enzyme
MSKFGAAFLGGINEHLAVDDPIDISFKENGYLFLAAPADLKIFERAQNIQSGLDVPVALLPPSSLERKFPWMNVADLGGGSYGYSGAGWFDPHGVLQAFKKKAQALGATFVADEVMGFEVNGPVVSSVVLRSGSRVPCAVVVNASGPQAAKVARMAGILDLPVRSKKRCVFQFKCRVEIQPCPLVVDPTGVYFRPEGEGFLCGTSPDRSNDPDSHDFDVDVALFDRTIWPVLANRVPAFDEIRRTGSWAGHYAVNTEDHNAILGPHPKISNYYFANGFSGHGLQQAPAVGRAIAELIVQGSYQTLDLSRLGFDRFARGALVEELNVV